MPYPATVTAHAARTVLDLYARVYGERHGQSAPIGVRAHRSGLGPVLMVPDSMAAAADDDAVQHCDTTGSGHPAIVLEGEAEFCDCCGTVAGCWTEAAQSAADKLGLGVFLEPYSSWAVTILP